MKLIASHLSAWMSQLKNSTDLLQMWRKVRTSQEIIKFYLNGSGTLHLLRLQLQSAACEPRAWQINHSTMKRLNPFAIEISFYRIDTKEEKKNEIYMRFSMRYTCPLRSAFCFTSATVWPGTEFRILRPNTRTHIISIGLKFNSSKMWSGVNLCLRSSPERDLVHNWR